MERPFYVNKEFRIYERCLADIAKAKPLSGESARIILYLLGNVGKENLLPSPTDTANALSLQRANASRAYAEMLEAGYIIKCGAGYSFHPYICFYGTDSQRDTAVEKLLHLNKRVLRYGNGYIDIATGEIVEAALV